MRHSSFGKGLLGLLALGLLSGSSASQTPEILIHDGDTVIGMGALQLLITPAVNDSGTWLLVADTDFFDTARDGCILRNGFVTLRENQALFSPPNALLDEWESISLTNSGNIAMAMKLKIGTTAKEGLFWNTLPVAIQDSVIDSPLLGPASTWVNFDTVKMTDSNSIFVLGDINNTAVGVGTSKERALLRYDLSNTGVLLGTTVLTSKSFDIPALGLPLVTLSSTDTCMSVNKHGDFIVFVGALGADAMMINLKTIVAQTASPSPVPGYLWQTLSSLPKVGINDFGEYIFSGSITSGSSNLYVIVKSNEVFALEGDILPKFSASPLGRGSSAPFCLGNSGDVYWRATAGTDEAYMRNDEPILQVNKTILGGNLVTGLEATEAAFAASPSGRFWVGRATVQVVGDSLVFADFGLVQKIPGCSGNPGKLSLTGGKAIAGNHLELALDNGQAPGVLPGIIFSSAQRVPGSDCGVNTAYGELLVSAAHRVGLIFAPVWDGTNPSRLTLPIPKDISLVDATFFAQGFFRGGNPHFTLTNGLRIEIGAP